MEIQNAYDEWSATYDADENLTRDLDQVVTRSRLGSQGYNSILEIGCGTGKNTAFLVQIGRSVRAVDFSEGMIAKAREKVRAGNVQFSLMDITKPWKFEEASFDLITCNLVLEHIRNLDHVFRESSQALRPKGSFLVNELHPFRQYDGKKARFYRNEEKIELNAFTHHVSDYFKAGVKNGLCLLQLEEYWHEKDRHKLPRLLSLTFERR